MAKIDSKGFAPNSKVTDVENREVTGEGENDGLPVVTSQRQLLTIFVRHANALWRRFRTSTHPEFRICNKNRKLVKGSRRFILSIVGSSRRTRIGREFTTGCI